MSQWSGRLDEPIIALDSQSLDELELLLGGLYGGRRAYNLPSQAPTDTLVDVTLKVPASTAEAAMGHKALLLTDVDGTPLARVTVAATSEENDAHRYVAGPVSPMQPAEHSPARKMRITRPLAAPGMESRPIMVAAFSHRPHSDEIASAVLRARDEDAQLWLVAVTGTTENHDLFPLIEELQRWEASSGNGRVGMLVVPNYSDSTRDEQRNRGQFVLDRLGADHVLDFTYGNDFHPVATTEQGTRGEGLVVLFTGLSGSGKSTLARALAEHFQKADDRKVTLLDGDEVRRFLTAGLGFSREDRNTNVERIGWVASLISKSGGVAICAPIAPFEESRARVRELAEASGRYILVHVSTPLDVCEKRDRKGLYAKARAGLIPDFTGIDSPYEFPGDADYVVDTSVKSVEDSITDLLGIIGERRKS